MFIRLLFNFQKLQIFRCFPFSENSGTPTFPISGNSGLRRFPIFSYYVITLFSCLHLSLVTLSAVVSTSLSPDPQFPFALVTFGSDRIRTYREEGEKLSPADSYRLSSPERVPEDTRLRTEETKTAGAEPEDLSVPKNLRQRRGRSK